MSRSTSNAPADASVAPTDVVAAALRALRPELTAFVRGRVGDDEVDDVLQVAALRAVEGAGSLRDPTRVRAWLYRVHRHAVIDALRRRARRHGWENPVADAEAFASDANAPPAGASAPFDPPPTCRCSLELAASLGATYGPILRLVHIEERSVTEAARALGLTVNNAGVRLHRARKALKKLLREHCGVRRLQDCVACGCLEANCCPT